MEEKKISKIEEGVFRIFILKILILLAFLGGIYTISLLTPVLTVVFFSGFLTILFSPLLDSLNKKRIPDWLGLIFIFIGLLLFLSVTLFAIIPIFIEQIGLLLSRATETFKNMEGLYKAGGVDALGIPSYLKDVIRNFNFGSFFEYLRSHTSSLGSFFGSSATSIISGSTSLITTLSGGIFQATMILVFTFFMSLERKSIRKFLYQVFPKKVSTYLEGREESFLLVLKQWIRGQIILGASIFVLTFVGLLILKLFGIHIDNIFSLALIAGLMEFIPYIGPFLALLPALAIALGMGVTEIIAVIVLYIIIQQMENNILVPMVMSKSLDLSPFLILLIMTVMASLFGITGILLAIPFAAILQILVGDMLKVKKMGR